MEIRVSIFARMERINKAHLSEAEGLVKEGVRLEFCLRPANQYPDSRGADSISMPTGHGIALTP